MVKRLTHLMNASGVKHKAKSENLISNTMQVMSDGLSLLSAASHEIDLQRPALVKPEMKYEYQLLGSDQNPSKDLLSGTEVRK